MRRLRTTEPGPLARLRRRRRERWEGLCKGCGICCYEKRIEGLKVLIDYSAPCRFLAPDRRCRVYADRFRLCRECRPMRLRHALFASYLPDNCGYVEAYRFWRRRTGK